MTDTYITTNYLWTAALRNYAVAKAAANAVATLGDCHAQNRILTLLADAHDTMLEVPAPTLGAVADKLQAFWEIAGDGPDTIRRMIVGDLRRIELQLAGVDEAEASAGLDMADVRLDWLDAVAEFDHYYELILEGPSDSWEGRDLDEMVIMQDVAEGELLSLPAPDLEAVVKKLTVLWEDDWHDPIEDSVDHLRIMRDLRRFALQHQN